MRLKNILWVIVLILIIIIASSHQNEEQESRIEGSYENCYMISLKEEIMVVLIDGKEWTIPCPVGTDTEKTDKIVDIVVKGNQIKKITWKEGAREDKVEAIDAEKGWIELKENGQVSLSANVQIYIKDSEGVRKMTKIGSLLNWEKATLFLQDQTVEVIIVNGDQNRETIKVLLHGTKEENYHEKVRLTASENYEVITKDGTKTYGAGQEFSLDNLSDDHSYTITCESGKIRMLSFTHTSGYPEYRGTILVTKTSNGYTIVNELPLEEYLYSVVSSEMPSSYPEEALKAQAVCARTYALYQMQQAYYSAYGAHVDDTVNSQVYNNVAETERSIQAVTATKGQYLAYENEPIPAYFYSTSCGTTSDVNDVWIKEEASPVYLQGHFQGEAFRETAGTDNDEKDGTLAEQTETIENIDLSTEKAFAKFLEEENDCYEKEEDWFRWKTTITISDLTKHINANVENGKIGTIMKVEVVERSQGGALKQIKITGKKGSLTVTGEYQIRKVLCPADTKLTLQSGETKTLDMLPSGYFVIDQKKKTLILTGGGYGHGVGLSQNGAKAMAELSYPCGEILDFYYPGTSLYELY